MRRWVIAGGVIVVLAIAGFFGLAPMLVERSMNVVAPVAV